MWFPPGREYTELSSVLFHIGFQIFVMNPRSFHIKDERNALLATIYLAAKLTRLFRCSTVTPDLQTDIAATLQAYDVAFRNFSDLVMRTKMASHVKAVRKAADELENKLKRPPAPSAAGAVHASPVPKRRRVVPTYTASSVMEPLVDPSDIEHMPILDVLTAQLTAEKTRIAALTLKSKHTSKKSSVAPLMADAQPARPATDYDLSVELEDLHDEGDDQDFHMDNSQTPLGAEQSSALDDGDVVPHFATCTFDGPVVALKTRIPKKPSDAMNAR